MLKIKNSGLDQYGAEPFAQQQFRTAEVERVNNNDKMRYLYTLIVVLLISAKS